MHEFKWFIAVRVPLLAVTLSTLLGLAGCGHKPNAPAQGAGEASAEPYYQIGPGDSLQIFVWQNKDLNVTVPVRPDGRISMPLIEDLQAAGKKPTQLARDIEGSLKEYVKDPVVTVIVTNFSGMFDQQVRVIGQAQKPQAIPYRDNMTVLDVMIAVGGLTEFADGNRATLARTINGSHEQFRIRLDDLIRDGEIDANVAMVPGDVLIIPQKFF